MFHIEYNVVQKSTSLKLKLVLRINPALLPSADYCDVMMLWVWCCSSSSPTFLALPCLLRGRQTLHRQSVSRSQSPVAWQHLCQWKRESQLISVRNQFTIRADWSSKWLLTPPYCHNVLCLLPTASVRCQQCARCWPGMEAVPGLTPVILWQPHSQHQWP